MSSPDAGPALRGFLSLDGDQLRMVDRILYEGHAYALHKAIEEAKIALSSSDRTEIRLHRPGVDLDIPVTQEELTALVESDVALLRKCIERALIQADRRPSDIALVIRTGGSSRIPAFVRMIEDLFGPERIEERNLFDTVVSGLATEARRTWGSDA